MINISDKTKCCGCSACYNICPKKAISMQEDNEGFLYPKVIEVYCVKCGLCLKTCPILNKKKDSEVLEIYGAKNKNVEEQKTSSSGGIFSLLANYILDNNGIVFGASYNNKWEVIHKFIDKKDDLDSLRRSKYVQSDMNNTYQQSKKFLDNNKFVLFCGTPCQIAGLKSFLNKDYEKLYCMDIFCHSVPSPKVWKTFLKQNFNINDIVSIDFRSKDFSWDNSYLKIILNNKKTYPHLPYYIRFITYFIPKKYYMKLLIGFYSISFRKGFLSSLYSRPSCHNCLFKGKKKQSDISVGDLWRISQIAPQMYDKNGVSVLTVNSKKGKFLFQQIKNNLNFTTINFDKMIKYNPYFSTSLTANPKREEFFKRYQKESLNNLINSMLGERWLLLKFFKAIIKRLKKLRYFK